MKKYLVIILMPLLLGCSSDNKPGKIELSIWKEIQKGHYEEAMNRFVKSSTIEKSLDSNALRVVERGFSIRMKNEIEEKGKITKVELINEKVEADNAEIIIVILFENGVSEIRTIDYTRINNEWRRV